MSILPSSPLFAQKEYLLQLSLNATTPKLLDLAQIQNAHLAAQFAKRNENANTLLCWIPISVTDDNNVISARGIEFKKGVEGIKVTHGGIPTEVERVGSQGSTLNHSCFMQSD